MIPLWIFILHPSFILVSFSYHVTLSIAHFACSYHNQEGIQIRPYDFGGLGGIYSIDPDLPGFTATYKPIIEKLKDAGYTENQDLFGAPYDFRLAGDGLESVSTHPCFLQFLPLTPEAPTV